MRTSLAPVSPTEPEFRAWRGLTWSRAGPGLVPADVAEAGLALAEPIREALTEVIADRMRSRFAVPAALAAPADRHGSVIFTDEVRHDMTYGISRRSVATLDDAAMRTFLRGDTGTRLRLHPAGDRLLRLDRPCATAADSDPSGYFSKKQKVIMQDDTVFRRGYSGFARLNFAVPESRLGDVLPWVVQVLPPIGFGCQSPTTHALAGGIQR